MHLFNFKKAFKLAGPLLIPLAIATSAQAYSPNPRMGVSPVVPGHTHEHESAPTSARKNSGSSKSTARSARPRALGTGTYEIPVLFLYTDDLARDVALYKAAGVSFVREPREQPYGTVAVFEDLYGNLWDLLQPRA